MSHLPTSEGDIKKGEKNLTQIKPKMEKQSEFPMASHKFACSQIHITAWIS